MRVLRSSLLVAALLALLPATASAIVPAGFQESTAFTGLVAPTSVRFAADGRVFVAEKRGRVLQYDSLADTTPTVFADLSASVHDFWDRGLLGMALDPEFTTGRPYVYVLYTYNKDPSSSAFPRWPDSCPTPPGATADGCVVSGRLSRLGPGGAETPLITDWCQQYPSHSVGDLVFGPGRALYVSAGDGASFNFADYGQDGNPVNPCGDPGGAAPAPPSAEGGALRSQDVRTPGDPAGGDGAILRVDPDTGAALPDNPAAGSTDPMARRIVAHGFRNPFRLALRPGTGEVWAGDVGWNEWEEVDRIAAPTASVTNHGWPCYEGAAPMGSYDNLDLTLCESLYAQGAAAHSAPYFAYRHADKVIAGEACPSGTSAVAGLAFSTGTTFPARYRGGLFVADYSRSCIWFMPADANGLPDPGRRESFASGAAGIVNLVQGPDGALYYPDLDNGAVRRISYGAPNGAPTAHATATPSSGAVPLAVQFDGTGSTDPEGDALSYAWDLDGDGAYDDSTAAKPTRTYGAPGAVTVRLRVTDPGGLAGMTTLTVTAGAPPVAHIDTPAAGTTWAVDDELAFSGGATDWSGAAVPPSGLAWKLLVQHCAAAGGDCHAHTVQTWSGVASGSFVAPDHEYPSHLELELTATDGDGLTRTVRRRLDPRTVALTFESSPAGLQLSVGAFSGAAPFTRTVIQGSTQSVSAPAPQTLGGTSYELIGWSDGGAQTHAIVAPTGATTYRATFGVPGLVGAWGFEEGGGAQALDGSGHANHGAIAGAARGSGRFGAGLSFDGLDDLVTVADAATLDLTTGMTVEAWVNPTALASSRRTAVIKEAPGALAYALYASDGDGRASGRANTGSAFDVRSPATIPLSAWTHLATTYDGADLRLYVNGALVATRPVTGGLVTTGNPLRFGGSSEWPGSFQGRLDEVRLYDRPLSAAEIAADMTAPVASGQPPVPAPALAVSPASLAFTATAGGSPPAGKTIDVANTGGGTLGFTVADDAAWLSVGPASGSAPAAVTATASPAGLAPGTYTATVTVSAAGASGSPQAVPVTFTVEPAPPPRGLVAAYGFDEASGRTAIDASGAGNPGVISGAARAKGRAGRALAFDGVDDWVTVADAASLDLSTGMTLEAWVRPTRMAGAWRTVVLKEQTRGLAYGLYAGARRRRPSAHAFTAGEERRARGTSRLAVGEWAHLATTYDGTRLRLYVDGVRVSSRAVDGALGRTAQALRIGGNAVWDEWFRGRIDEVRVYDRALRAADIRADMGRAVSADARRTTASAARRARRHLRIARRRASLERERARRGLPLRAHRGG